MKVALIKLTEDLIYFSNCRPLKIIISIIEHSIIGIKILKNSKNMFFGSHASIIERKEKEIIIPKKAANIRANLFELCLNPLNVDEIISTAKSNNPTVRIKLPPTQCSILKTHPRDSVIKPKLDIRLVSQKPCLSFVSRKN